MPFDPDQRPLVERCVECFPACSRFSRRLAAHQRIMAARYGIPIREPATEAATEESEA